MRLRHAIPRQRGARHQLIAADFRHSCGIDRWYTKRIQQSQCIEAAVVTNAALQHGIILLPRLRVIQIKMDRPIVASIIVNAAFFHSAEDPLFFHTDPGIQNTDFYSSLHYVLRRGDSRVAPTSKIYSPRSSRSIGASSTAAGSTPVTSRSTPQS